MQKMLICLTILVSFSNIVISSPLNWAVHTEAIDAFQGFPKAMKGSFNGFQRAHKAIIGHDIG